MKSKNSKSAFAILEVVVALALTLLVASVVFFYGRIIIENAKISKLKSDIDLTVSSVKNGFYSLYEKMPGQLSLDEIKSSFSDDKGTLSCSGSGTSDTSCYADTVYDANNLSTISSGNYISAYAANSAVKNAVNQLVLSGNATRGLISLTRISLDSDTAAYSAAGAGSSAYGASFVSNKYHDDYEIPFNSSFKGYWFPFTNSIQGFSFASSTSTTDAQRLAIQKNFYIAIGGKDLSSVTYTSATVLKSYINPIVTKQQAYKFASRFNTTDTSGSPRFVGYDIDYNFAKSPSTAPDTDTNSEYCHKLTTTSDGSIDLSASTTTSPSMSVSPREIKKGCFIIVKAA